MIINREQSEERAKCIAIIEALKEELMEDFENQRDLKIYEFHRGQMAALSEAIDSLEDEITRES